MIPEQCVNAEEFHRKYYGRIITKLADGSTYSLGRIIGWQSDTVIIIENLTEQIMLPAQNGVYHTKPGDKHGWLKIFTDILELNDLPEQEILMISRIGSIE